MVLNFAIRRPKHAIGEFTATLKFANVISMTAFAEVASLLKEAAERLNLPAPITVQLFNIAVGNVPFGQGAEPAPVPGAGYQRFSENGEVACSLICGNDSIVLTLREYERWHSILPIIIETFSKIGAAYISEVPALRAFHVQYVNEFLSRAPETRCTAEIFRKDSKWLPPFALESDEPWHCHVGQFIPATEEYRHLVNLNCDISPAIQPGEVQPHTYVRALILAACQYDLPEKGPLVVDVESLPAVIEKHFDDIHSLEKRLLGEIISDEYLAAMGDGANEH